MALHGSHVRSLVGTAVLVAGLPAPSSTLTVGAVLSLHIIRSTSTTYVHPNLTFFPLLNAVG